MGKGDDQGTKKKIPEENKTKEENNPYADNPLEEEQMDESDNPFLRESNPYANPY